jgi:signal transduction histidine kinase
MNATFAIVRNVMRFRTWPVLSAGFGTLLLLIAVSAAALNDSIEKVYDRVAAIHQMNRERRTNLDQLRSELYLGSIFVRDYLLESSTTTVGNERRTLDALRKSMHQHLAELERAGGLEDQTVPESLRQAAESYWRSIDTVFDWTPAEKTIRASAYLRQTLIPYRDAVLAAAAELAELSAAETRKRQQEVLNTEGQLKDGLRTVLLIALLLGGCVAVLSIVRTHSLERSAAAHLLQIENHAAELRRLSQKLATLQEDERRNISRELHDQVGQLLTALRMELGNLEELRHAPNEDFTKHLSEAKYLTEDTLKTVRNISTGLRPSVLDELGLAPALKWQIRDFSRRTGVDVDLRIDGNPDHLPDSHRICIYRVVQEALTNCARHSSATKVRVTLCGRTDSVSVIVEDDGVGFDPAKGRERGLGLLGVEERVRELGGRVDIQSSPARGTSLRCELLLPAELSL